MRRFRDIIIYFPKSTRSRDSEHIHVPFRGNLSCAHLVLLCVNQYTAFAVSSFTNSKDTIGTKIKNGPRDPDHPHYGVVYHPKANTTTCIQKLATLASAVPEIWSRASKLKMAHHNYDPGDASFRGALSTGSSDLTVYLLVKFNDSSFSRSRDIVGAFQNLNGSRHLTSDHAPFRDDLSSLG